MRKYYHPGTHASPDGEVYWHDEIFARRRDAEREARSLARERSGTPVVAWWPQSSGTMPGPDGVVGCDAVGRAKP